MPDAAYLTDFTHKYGDVSKVVSRLIRPAFIARPGKTLVWGDWSAIEARVLPWLSASKGGDAVLDVFRANDRDPSRPDIYMTEAGRIYAVPPANVGKAERQVGKVTVLALGFGGGVNALASMATGYGIHMEHDLQQRIVRGWREGNPWAVDFWAELMEAFQNARSHPGEVFPAGRVAYVYHPGYLRGTMMCYLPDGRPIAYPALRRDKVTFEDEVTGDTVTEWRLRYQAGYERRSLWHGTLAENITQGTAASLLRACMRRLDASGLVVGHTHDEVIEECPEAEAESVGMALKREMEMRPDWAGDLPLVSEVDSNWYYTKALG